ncbi:Maf-like protein [Alphaproteobacteria bacterium KMM 3653]|uniref:Nucleoside triphosphate pyrophosphatase n=1 Tax=Harenicola maris TaxID=2841044 RepID=A0AAP2CNH7_9RHOB|nr:Maf-like protein [Harenicola maris]
MPSDLILASGSSIRAELLRNAGVPFEVSVPRVDEQMIKAAMQAEGFASRDIADALADAKAQKISAKNPEAFVLGCDQVLEFDGRLIDKSSSPEEAAALLAQMSGKPHRLFSAAVIYKDLEPQWRHIARVDLTMRVLSEAFQHSYIDDNWEEIRHCVGGYMLEGAGVRLFSQVRGDYFAVLGLPLLEVLSYLGQRGVITT